MKKSIGLLEFKSIAKGIEVTDEILKVANVDLIFSSPICPGKYVSMVSGEIAAVNHGMKTAEQLGDIFQIEALTLSNIHPDVLKALSGTCDVKNIQALGVIETMSAVSSLMVADTAIKSSNIQLIEVRIARGLGGKGFTLFSGEISSVNRAIEACKNAHQSTGEILCATLISSPNQAIIDSLL
jgi:microcompartment protein CcmL/EutN